VTELPTIRTERLVLGWFDTADAPALEKLAGAPEVADTTLVIPHPYERAHAIEFESAGDARALLERHASEPCFVTEAVAEQPAA